MAAEHCRRNSQLFSVGVCDRSRDTEISCQRPGVRASLLTSEFLMTIKWQFAPEITMREALLTIRREIGSTGAARTTQRCRIIQCCSPVLNGRLIGLIRSPTHNRTTPLNIYKLVASHHSLSLSLTLLRHAVSHLCYPPPLQSINSSLFAR